MKSKIKVLIADDHAIVRMGLASLLNAEADLEVVGEAENGEVAVQPAARASHGNVNEDNLNGAQQI